MALGAETYVMVRPSGSDSGGGGFDPGNANFAADLAATSATGTGPVASSASYTFVAGDVGAILFVKSGTNWVPGWYPIASVSGGNATLNAAIGAVPLYGSNNPRINATAGCATTAGPTAGTWGIDYSRQDAAQVSYTDLASTTGTTNPSQVTSAAFPFGKDHVGNLIQVTAGTNWTTGTYEVVSVSGTTATLDRAAGSAATLSSGTAALGGGYATIVKAVAVATVAGNVICVKNGSTYSLTGNKISPSPFSNPVVVMGFTAYPGDGGIAAFDATGMTAGQDAFGVGDHVTMANISVTGAKHDSFVGTGQSTLRNCYSLGSPTNQGIEAVSMVVGCYSSTSVWNCGTVVGTVMKSSSTATTFDRCILWGTGSQSLTANSSGTIADCAAYKGGFVSTQIGTFANNVSWGSTSTAYARNTEGGGRTAGSFLNNAYGSATSGVTGGNVLTDGPYLILTANPFNAPDSGDFSLNNTAGGGAVLRAAGFPGVFPNISTTGYPDVGGVQHQDPAAGGVNAPAPPIRSNTYQFIG